jgi:hypothetical protein
MATLYERVKSLQARGFDAAAIRTSLEKEGVPRADIDLVLGAGMAADLATMTKPLTFLSRLTKSRAVFALLLIVGLSLTGAVTWFIGLLFGGGGH